MELWRRHARIEFKAVCACGVRQAEGPQNIRIFHIRGDDVYENIVNGFIFVVRLINLQDKYRPS